MSYPWMESDLAKKLHPERPHYVVFTVKSETIAEIREADAYIFKAMYRLGWKQTFAGPIRHKMEHYQYLVFRRKDFVPDPLTGLTETQLEHFFS